MIIDWNIITKNEGKSYEVTKKMGGGKYLEHGTWQGGAKTIFML